MYFYFFKKENTISCLKKEAKLPNIFYFNQKFMKNLKKRKEGWDCYPLFLFPSPCSNANLVIYRESIYTVFFILKNSRFFH